MAFEIRFADESLAKLQYEDAKRDRTYPPGIAQRFRKRLQSIRSAAGEHDLHALKGNGFEKLQGKRGHQHSMKLNDQWRLILEIKEGNPKKIVWVVGIEDYH